MSNRVTADEVGAIIDYDTDIITDISAFITAANLTVTAMLSSAGLSDDQLKEIERWLAAHFIAIQDPRAKSKEFGDSKEDYEGAVVGEGLKLTRYGQQVLVLDTSGTMASASGPTASISTINWNNP